MLCAMIFEHFSGADALLTCLVKHLELLCVIQDALGGFPNEIKPKIRYLLLLS